MANASEAGGLTSRNVSFYSDAIVRESHPLTLFMPHNTRHLKYFSYQSATLIVLLKPDQVKK